MKGPVAIDANLLLLLVVGSASRNYIAMHKRLKDEYTVEDLDCLLAIIETYSEIILLPNTLTEVSNLLRHIKNPAKSIVGLQMRALIDIAGEVYIPSRTAANRDEFIALGLTDATLLELSSIVSGGAAPTLLTVDLDLARAASMRGYRVVNFNHYR